MKDRKPSEFNAHDMEMLRGLAAPVEEEIARDRERAEASSPGTTRPVADPE